MGNSKGGSFGLAASKSSIVHMAVESYLKEIQDPLNTDLIPQLFAMNGWDLDRLPKFEFEQIEESDLDILSKFLQRVASVGLIQDTPENINQIAEWVGLPSRVKSDMDIEELRETLTMQSSSAAEGLQTTGDGTSTSAGGKDSSVSNSENT